MTATSQKGVRCAVTSYPCTPLSPCPPRPLPLSPAAIAIKSTGGAWRVSSPSVSESGPQRPASDAAAVSASPGAAATPLIILCLGTFRAKLIPTACVTAASTGGRRGEGYWVRPEETRAERSGDADRDTETNRTVDRLRDKQWSAGRSEGVS